MQADPLRWKALTVVCAAFFMTILDVSIVNVALPSIGESLHFTRENLQWVITAYAITYGGFLLLAGRLADLYGRRRVFMIGVVIFTLASLFCGLAWSEGVLIASRAVQGIGRRGDHAVRALDRDDHVRGGRRAQQGARHLGSAGRRRRRGRRPRGRHPDDLPRLGVDLLHQRPGRRAGPPPHAALRAREPSRGAEVAGHRGCGHRHRRARAARVRGVEGARPRLELRLDAEPPRRRRRPPDRVRVIEARAEGSAHAVPHLPDRDGHGSERLGAPARRGHLRELLPAHAVRAEHPRLQRDQDRADVRRHRRQRRPVGGTRPEPDDAVRGEADARRRLRRDDRRLPLLHPGLGTRIIRERAPARLPPHGVRAAVHLHPGLDRGARGSQPRRSGARVGTDQHLRSRSEAPSASPSARRCSSPRRRSSPSRERATRSGCSSGSASRRSSPRSC